MYVLYCTDEAQQADPVLSAVIWLGLIVHTVEDKKTFPFGISRTMLLRGVSLPFYVNGRLKTVIERS